MQLGRVTMANLGSLLFPTSTETTLQPGAIQPAGLVYAGNASMSLVDDKLVFTTLGFWLVQLSLQVNVTSQLNDSAFSGAIDFNGDLLGHDFIDASPLGGMEIGYLNAIRSLGGAQGTVTEDVVLSMQRRVQVTTPGDFVRALFAVPGGVIGNDSLARGYSLSAIGPFAT